MITSASADNKNRLLVTAGLLLAPACGLIFVAAAPAQGLTSPVTFSATASADSVHVITSIAGFPATSTPVDSGGPTSQVSLSSSGGGRAYAAAPDPGTFATSLPGLGAGLLGGLLPIAIPGYPLAANADDQNPSQTIGAGGYELKADVKPSSAQAATTGGGTTPAGNAARIKAEALISSDASGVAVTATSDVQGLTVGPLTIGHVRSDASVTSDSDGMLTKKSTLTINGVEIGDLPVGLTPSGFTVAGVPVPADTQGTLNKILAAANVTVATFPKTETPTGVAAAGVIITQTQDLPQLGRTVLTYRIGGVSVNLLAAAADPSASDGGSFPSDPPLGQGPVAAPPTAALGSAEGAALSAPGELGSGMAPPPTVAGVDNAPVPGAQVAALRAAQVLPSITSNGLYLSIVIAGLLGLGAMQLFRTLGVKLSWTS